MVMKRYVILIVSIFVLLIALSNPIISITMFSIISGERSIIILFPKPIDLFNRTFNIPEGIRYYVEIWAVVPEGIVEVVKTRIGSENNFMIKLTADIMRNVTFRWIEFYKSHGKFWRPSLIIQFSTYDPYESISILAFGYSIVYDPEIFVSPTPYTEMHILTLNKFPIVKKFHIERRIGSELSLSSCNISTQGGLPGPCQSPTDCFCCTNYFTRVALGEKLFDSSDPSIPEAFRDKIPILILHLDQNAQTQLFGVTYYAENVDRWVFRITIFDRTTERVIWGDASGELISSSKIDSLVYVDRSTNRLIGIIYRPGSFKLYTAYGYTCCYEKLCWDYATVCDPNGFSALLMIVTYVDPGVFSSAYTLNEAPLNISYFRSRLGFSQYYVPAGSAVEINRDPHEIRINVVNILMTIILDRLGIKWYENILLSIAADNMPIAIEIIGSSGMRKSLKLYDPYPAPATAYVARITAIYMDPTGSQEVYKLLLIDVR